MRKRVKRQSKILETREHGAHCEISSSVVGMVIDRRIGLTVVLATKVRVMASVGGLSTVVGELAGTIQVAVVIKGAGVAMVLLVTIGRSNSRGSVGVGRGRWLHCHHVGDCLCTGSRVGEC